MLMLRSQILSSQTLFRVLAAVTLLAGGPLTMAPSHAAETPLVFEIRVDENRVDGCTDCGCRLKGVLDPGAESDLWVTFGLVAPGDDGAWQAQGSPSHCGVGMFDDVAPGFHATIGMPFVILQIRSTPSLGRSDALRLETELEYRELRGFDQEAEPEYARRQWDRVFLQQLGEEMVIPVLMPDAALSSAFQVHEVLLSMGFHAPAQGLSARYGAISVTADAPGARVFLDGGMAGRIIEGEPLLLNNVLTGKHDVAVIDHSGRQRTTRIRVRRGKTAAVHLEVFDLADADTPAEMAPLGENPQGQAEYWRAKDGVMVVHIPGGSFLMGSPAGKGEQDERPQHEVSVDGFLMDKTEVTWRQYRKYAQATNVRWPKEPIWGIRDNYPISFILYREAVNFCHWVGGRLPTEPEWEFAARGTRSHVYPWGDDWDATRCNSIAGGMHQPEPAGFSTSCVSPFGVLDLAGNVWEWTANAYGPYPLEIRPDAFDLDESGRPPLRTMRGGAWMNHPAWLRSAYRHERSPSSRNMDHGFRCVMDLQEDES